jgi:hypothetical protein
MYAPLLFIAFATALLSGVMTWAMSRRYGRRRALLVPVLALAAVVFVMWRMTQAGDHARWVIAAFSAAIAGPSVAGALVGLMLSAQKRR